MNAPKSALQLLPEGGVLSLIQADLGSNGELFSLMILRDLLEEGENVFMFLYEPFRVFESNSKMIGLNVKEYLGKNFHVLDAFGSVYSIPRNENGIYQLSGYLDDSVFVIKLKEWGTKILDSKEWDGLWIFTYTSTGICKLFRRPYLVYRMIWAMRELLLSKVKTNGTILTLSQPECPEISNIAYVTSDVVIETHVIDEERVGIVTKGPNEGKTLTLFGGS
ncbi:hypothetical protein [Thermococcus sp.]|uniref:hypothetical protein n=1 Tax=Thermococcus sp. TaxID=35749 RepID=UPI0026321B96|nr:hypothetical protein [Thermococcus sp.]